ncbi:iron-binding protein [Ralstonia pickettii]|uniref:Iron-binding protein n=1 Tax=Ralstonia pickettii TaxID=329 RepID=A0A2N4TLP5_RALPI|nr:CDGSH iron-sulfur domain-containing protein [Ralstonia pickettii]PLC40604.1 iron-binding protein [Ralstonia pickettii]
MPIETVVGEEATIHFDASRCIHSRTCVLSHPDVFMPNVEGKWINPDAQPAGELMHIARLCPSGAISVVPHTSLFGSRVTDSNDIPLVNTVRIRENGPLAIEAELVLQGKDQSIPRVTLCRCGESKRKPFCDGSHVEAEFVATGEPAKAEFETLSTRNGPLRVDPLLNGPLKFTGNLEIVSGTGRTCNQVKGTHLCRCGASKNKPYCDGSHKIVGFNAP